jgi:hypothetical protein
LLLGRRSPRICSLVDALPNPKIHIHAAPPIYEMPSKSFLSLEGPDDHDADEMVDRVAWLVSALSAFSSVEVFGRWTFGFGAGGTGAVPSVIIIGRHP